MTRYFLGLVFALLLSASPALGQDRENVVKHEFQDKDRTVYVVFSPYAVEVWSIEDNGDCLAYPSLVEYEDSTVRFPGGTEWKVSPKSDTSMKIEFPDGKTVLYEEADRSPATLCNVGGGKDI